MLSCNSPENDIYIFDPGSLEENTITLADIADDITYIPLDNNFPLGLIHNNFKFICNSIYFSVLDLGVLEFSRNGEFLQKIGNIGRGPGEYTNYVDFTIDNKTRTIYIPDRGVNSSIIKVYSGTGDFLRNITIPEEGENFQTIEFYNSKLFVFNYLQFGDSKYNWIVLDTTGNLITKKERTILMFKSGWSGSRGTYKSGNKLYYWNSFNDTVFSILPDLSYRASFIICPGEHRFPRTNIVDPKQLKLYMHIEQVFETSRFIVIKYFYKRPVFALIEKKSFKSFSYYLESEESNTGAKRTGGILNDFDGGPKFLPESYFEENGREYLVGLIDSYKILIHKETNEFKNSSPKYPEKKKELEKLASSLKETDNPVLIMMKLKK